MKKLVKRIVFIFFIIILIKIIITFILWLFILINAQFKYETNKGIDNINNTKVTKSVFLPLPSSKENCKKNKKNIKIPVSCSIDNDYWVGAVIACKGIKNLPTELQLNEISKKIYHNGNSIYDTSIAKQYGLPEDLSQLPVSIWTRDVDFISSGAALAITFEKYKSNSNTMYGRQNKIHSICIINY